MSLEYKTQVYIRKAIRQAAFKELPTGQWTATLPEFDLQATGDDQTEAEQNLLIRLTIYVYGSEASGHRLPIVEDIDHNKPAGGKPVNVHTEQVPRQEVIELTVRESELVAESLLAPPSPAPYLSDAANEYREFMGK